jgi:uncharacterized repeat protein (TIGR01451 family)
MYFNYRRLVPFALLLIGFAAAAGLATAEPRSNPASLAPAMTAPLRNPALAADIRFDKVGPGAAYPSDYVQYFLDIRNAGSTTTSVILTDTLDAGMNWIATNMSPGVTCAPPVGGAIRCNIAELPPSPAVLRAVTFTVQIGWAVPAGTVVINVGEALSPDDPAGVKIDVVYTTILAINTPTPTPTATPTATATPPANDDFANAAVIDAPAYRATEDTGSATNQPEDPLQPCTTGGPQQNYRSVWFRYTPATTVLLNVSTLGSDYDTVLSVHSGTWPGLVDVACNDNIQSVSSLQSRLVFTATADITYYLEVTSRTPGSGDLVFQVNEHAPVDLYLPLAMANAPIATPTPTPSPTPTAPLLPGNAVISNINYLGTPPNEPDEWVAITNGGELPVNIGGWRLSDNAGNTLVFPGYVLNPGQTCRVYTNEYHPEWGGLTYGIGYGIWDNAGDCAHLVNATGREVSTYCYPVRVR